MTDFGQMWLTLAAPRVALFLLWGRHRGARRSVLAAGAVVGLVNFGIDGQAVVLGDLPRATDPLALQLGWTVVGGWLWATTNQVRNPTNAGATLLAFAAAGLGAWVPMVVLFAHQPLLHLQVVGALVLISATTWLGQFGLLELAGHLGPLGLTMDGTTVAAAWLAGLLHLVAWTALFLVPLGERASPLRPSRAEARP